MKTFVIILKYLAPLNEMNMHREDHLEFLNQYYEKNFLLISGRKTSNDGGVIIAISDSSEKVEKFIQSDPFYLKNLAQYEIHEFIATKYNQTLKDLL